MIKSVGLSRARSLMGQGARGTLKKEESRLTKGPALVSGVGGHGRFQGHKEVRRGASTEL